ncbi:MAG: tetratricopeptide repeat protein [Methanothrix sp.]|nr:tetratricopeptide repeat protein [Methanothrix sp.]
MPGDKLSKFATEAEPASTNLSNQEPILGEAEISPQNQDVLLQIASLIRLTEGFRLGFVKCNQPVQCRQMAARLKKILADEANIISVELKEPVSSLRRAVLQELESDKSEYVEKRAIMVLGFEHSVPSEGPAPALDELNQSRDNFPKSFSGPVLIWLPDYALTRLAREAPDFWGWRSGVFELSPEKKLMASVEKTIIQDAEADRLSLVEKRERADALDGLIRDYREMPRGERENRAMASLLQRQGNLRYLLGEYDQARRQYEESLKIEQELGNKRGMGQTLHQMGNLAYITGDLGKARRLYSESLMISQELGDKSSVASTLHQMGMMAQNTDDLGEARRLYSESLKIKQELGDKSSVASTLHQMGMMAQDTGDLGEARRLYSESLNISQVLGNKSGMASTLHQMGMMAQHTGDLGEARRLYSESLNISQELGNKSGMASTLHQMGMMAQDTGDLGEARRLYEESLKISQVLGNKSGMANTLHQMGNLVYVTGDLGEARRLYSESLKINQELGDKRGVAITLAQSSLLEENEGHLARALELIKQAEALFLELKSPMADQAQKDRERLEKKERGS